jgi:hypothetical protein
LIVGAAEEIVLASAVKFVAVVVTVSNSVTPERDWDVAIITALEVFLHTVYFVAVVGAVAVPVALRTQRNAHLHICTFERVALTGRTIVLVALRSAVIYPITPITRWNTLGTAIFTALEKVILTEAAKFVTVIIAVGSSVASECPWKTNSSITVERIL